jgi:4-diphosphocytidyl-2-C-methyl-D-erythritol kinase
MINFPGCKINLGLHVINKRKDGFHNIETVFYPVKWQDALEILDNKRAKKNKISFHGYGLSIEGKPESNLCVKAYRLLAEDVDLPPVSIHLFKHIPMGAGLGGGSADAAFTIKLLNEKFGLKLSIKQMQHYAAELGSDCAVFITNKPAFAYGRGDKFKPLQLDLGGWHIALVHPGIHVSTADAYAAVKKRGKTVENKSLQQIIQQPVTKWKKMLENDFELSVFKKYPTIEKLKEQMYDAGATYAAMSGSGSAVFGLFKEEPKLTAAMKKMKFYTGKL